jgi:tetratricopeptide (TPR) repeat protein
VGKLSPICVVLLILGTFAPALAAAIPKAAFFQISAAISAGNGAEALRLTDAALLANDVPQTDRSRLLLARGLADHLLGDPDHALADLTEAISSHGLTVPEQARAYLERGLILDGMARLDDAIGDYGAVLRLVPNSPTALNNRANVFRRQNRFEEARRDYLASLAADNPAPEYPYYGLGQIAESQGKADEAKNFYGRALAANPGYALASQRLAELGGAPSTAASMIVLRPPKGAVAEAAPVVLRPPGARKLAVREVPSPATVRPAGYSARDEGLGLRPAFDNPGGQNVQLGAWRQESEAAEGWNSAVKAAGGALTGLAPHIIAADLPGKGRYYRLRVTTPDGKRLCASLTAKGLDCMPARD